MPCNFKIKETNLYSALERLTGKTVSLSTYISTISDSNGFVEKFVDNVMKRFNVDVYNIPDDKVDLIAKYVKEFQNAQSPDVDYSAAVPDTDNNTELFGYRSIDDRDFCKHIAATLIYDIHKQIIFDKNTTIEEIIKAFNDKQKDKKPITKKQYIISACIGKLKQIVRNRLMDNGIATKEQIEQAFKTNNTLQIEEWFSSISSRQNDNLLALYKEVIGNKKEFFESIFNDSRLFDLRFDKTDVISEDEEYDKSEDQDLEDTISTDDNSDNDSQDNKDNSISNLNNKDGSEFTTFLKHLDTDIKIYLNSLPKLVDGHKNNKGEYDNYDLDNALGIPDVMNFEECANILYTSATYMNPNDMISSIRRIADSIPGFGAFHKLADNLEENPSFSAKIYSNFAKYVAEKLETINDENDTIARIPNKTANRLTAFKFQLLNDIRASALNVEADDAKQEYYEIFELGEKYEARMNTKEKQSLMGNLEVKKQGMIKDGQLRRNQDIGTRKIQGESLCL